MNTRTIILLTGITCGDCGDHAADLRINPNLTIEKACECGWKEYDLKIIMDINPSPDSRE